MTDFRKQLFIQIPGGTVKRIEELTREELIEFIYRDREMMVRTQQNIHAQFCQLATVAETAVADHHRAISNIDSLAKKAIVLADATDTLIRVTQKKHPWWMRVLQL